MSSRITRTFLQDLSKIYFESFKKQCLIYFDEESTTIYVEQFEGSQLPPYSVSFQLASQNKELANLVESDAVDLRVVPFEFFASKDTSNWMIVQGSRLQR